MVKTIKSNLLFNMNINFNISSIKLRAMNNDEFIKGLQIYDSGNISTVSITKVFDSESLEDNMKIVASIKEGSKIEKVELRIDTHGDIIRYRCGCKEHAESIYTFCRHLVAILIFIYNNNRSADIKNKSLDSYLESDYINIINTYEDNLKNYVKEKNKTPDLSLIPKLVKEDNALELYASIEKDEKAYIVRDIFSLAENIKFSKDFQYGKGLVINHNISSFDETSRQLANLIVNLCYDYADIYGYTSGTLPSKRGIKIPSSQLILLFNILKNSTIKYSIDTEQYDITFVEENPYITFKLSKNTAANKYDFYIEDFADNICDIYEFIDTTFIFSKTNLFKCDKAFNDYAIPAINKLREAKDNTISISEKNFSEFYSTVIVPLKGYAEVLVDEDISNSLITEKLITKIYLDTTGVNSINADIVFSYGDIEINTLNTERPDNAKFLSRNILEENGIVQFILDCGFIEKNKKYVLTGEGNIYDFIYFKLNELLQFCEVNVSDKLKKIKVKSPSTMSMGVKLTNNLIEIDMENIEFNLSELKNILSSYRTKRKYYRLKDGSFINLDNQYFDTLDALDRDLDIVSYIQDNDKVVLPKCKSINLENTLEAYHNVKINKSIEYRNIVDEIINKKNLDIMIPDNLNGILRNYQKTGYKWLKTLSEYGLGGILADDMGLGKTLQVIALLYSEADEHLPSIVVCPTSLIYNWINEVEKFAPSLTTMAVLGTKQQREDALLQVGDVDLIITSYDLLKRDISLYSKLNFKYCILDEAQYIKNSYTQNALSVKKINSAVRFALTGTPIENSLSDLWSIFDFVLPDFLLSYRQFKDKFETPIIKDADHDVLSKLHHIIEPFILRRLKSDVLKDLPDKIEINSYAQMDAKQRRLYTAELMKASHEFNQEVETQGYERSQIKILALLTRLRQICCHPSLYIENYNGESAKLELCMQIVNDSIQGGHKILIFSQFTSMLDIISEQLNNQGIRHYILTGSTKSENRIELIDQFNNDDTPVFLISLKAGGTGLNLTGADIVIHFDPWWNNSAQNQATDRAHRIGQLNKVQVFRLITKGTIEEKIELLQSRKQNLVDSIVTSKEVMLSSLTKDEISSLFEI